jgi:hypothetical protein
MFIDTEYPQKTRAPEGRNVVNEDPGSPGRAARLGWSFASVIFRSSGATKTLWSPLTINIMSLRERRFTTDTIPARRLLTHVTAHASLSASPLAVDPTEHS